MRFLGKFKTFQWSRENIQWQSAANVFDTLVLGLPTQNPGSEMNRDLFYLFITLLKVYILYSASHGKTYVGQTGDLEKRLNFRNHLGKGTFTSKYRPWVLMQHESFAKRVEKWFKTGTCRNPIKR